MRAFSNLRVLHNNKTSKWQSIKLIINMPKQSNPHTGCSKYEDLQFCTHARAQDDHFLIFSFAFTVCCKPSSCILRLFVFQHKFAFNNFFFSSHFFLCDSFILMFFLFFCFFTLYPFFPRFFDIIRGKVLCLTTCSFGGHKIAS